MGNTSHPSSQPSDSSFRQMYRRVCPPPFLIVRPPIGQDLYDFPLQTVVIISDIDQILTLTLGALRSDSAQWCDPAILPLYFTRRRLGCEEWLRSAHALPHSFVHLLFIFSVASSYRH